jgi:hypothetical protein
VSGTAKHHTKRVTYESETQNKKQKNKKTTQEELQHEKVEMQGLR